MIHVALRSEALDPLAALTRLDRGAETGAIASFLGLCRGEGSRLTALEIEHYPGMADAQITRIAQEAARRWPVGALLVEHRYGLVAVGEAIVIVAAASAHRGPAFDAVRFVMDYLKTDAPFWKREHLAGGAVGPWVEARGSDEAARDGWG